MRHLFFRNYYDAYGWQWEDGCSRFDILDLSRATRALSPDGINWPVDAEGKPTNRLELLSAENSLAHEDAHDALSDVNATIAVAKMIKDLRPRLFGHYLRVSNKREVRVFIKNNRTFVYTSGKYPGEYEKTTIVYNLNPEIGDKDSETLVYDLRINPADLVGLSPKELADRWRYNPEKPEDKLPIKSLKFNRCPAIARETVLDAKVCKRLKLDTNVIRRHQKILEDNPKFFEKILQAQEILNQGRQEKVEITDLNAQTSLYSGGFIPDSDKRLQSKVATSSLDELRGLGNEFKDKRLRLNMPSYIARNFPNELDEIEKSKWQDYCRKKLREGGKDSPAERFNARLTQLAGQVSLSREKKYLVEELNLYAQSVLSELEA